MLTQAVWLVLLYLNMLILNPADLTAKTYLSLTSYTTLKSAQLCWLLEQSVSILRDTFV